MSQPDNTHSDRETNARERPILFSGPMVRAILEGRKTQTRRVASTPKCTTAHERRPLWDLATVDPGGSIFGPGPYLHLPYAGGDLGNDVLSTRVRCPYGYPGDLLWVRETWTQVECDSCLVGPPVGTSSTCYCRKLVEYRADGRVAAATWRPSVFMPRWASRITLRVTGVRVERVCSISRADCVAEGLAPTMRNDSEQDIRVRFADLWDGINGKRDGCSWGENPWVWVVSFARAGEVSNAA